MLSAREWKNQSKRSFIISAMLDGGKVELIFRYALSNRLWFRWSIFSHLRFIRSEKWNTTPFYCAFLPLMYVMFYVQRQLLSAPTYSTSNHTDRLSTALLHFLGEIGISLALHKSLLCKREFTVFARATMSFFRARSTVA